MRHALFGCVIFFSSIAHGGLSVLQVHREVSAAIASTEVDPPFETQVFKKDSLGTFNRTAEVHVANDLGDHSDLRTSQNSNIAAGMITASGDFFASSSGEALTYRNAIDTSFHTTNSFEYHLAMNFQFDRYQGQGLINPFLTMHLRELGTGTDLIDKAYNNDHVFNPVHFTQSGTLLPGDYQLTFELHDTVGLVENIGHYDLSFSGASSGPSAVPLPPAGWAGLLTLSGLAAGKWWMRRRAKSA